MSTEATQDTNHAPEDPPEAVEPAAPEAPAEPTAEPADAAEATPEAGEAAPETPEAKHKRAGGWQRKIEKLERELAETRARLTQPAAPAEPAKAKTADEQAAEYVESLVEKRLAAREVERQRQEAMASFQQRTQAVRAELPDFDDVVAAADVVVPPALAQAILTSEQGPRIMYQLASSRDELARISALPPLVAAREIGRLEAKLASGTATPAKPTPNPVTRKPAAPAPIDPVKTRGPAAVKPPSEMSYDEYRRWRDQGGK